VDKGNILVDKGNVLVDKGNILVDKKYKGMSWWIKEIS
jgi:hypothetical protein